MRPSTRFCKHCGKNHPDTAELWYVYPDGRRECRARIKQRYKKWAARSRDKLRRNYRQFMKKSPDQQLGSVLKQYWPHLDWRGALAEFRTLEAAQSGLCAICKQPPVANDRLSVDHCHKTGKVRGLLCMRCNSALGHFGDDVERIKRAIQYVTA